jgi:hypothetical protein
MNALQSRNGELMATAKLRHRRGKWLRRLLIALVPLALLGWFYRAPISGYASTATAYGAHSACSCRFVDGRPLGQCRDDFADASMRLVMLSEDEENRSVTASIPLLSSQTATYHKGWGCLLQPLED